MELKVTNINRIAYQFALKRLPTQIVRKCKDRDCKHNCGGKYYREFSATILRGQRVFTIKYMCKARWISVKRKGLPFKSLRSAERECIELNSLTVQ